MTVGFVGDQAKGGAQNHEPLLEGVVAWIDVLQLQIGIAHHVQQHEGVGGVDLFLREVFSPCFSPNRVVVVLVLCIVPKEHHVVGQVHPRDVICKFDEDGDAACSVVGPRHR